MSELLGKMNIEILHPRAEHFLAIQNLCKKVYPFSKPWSLQQLESHQSHFPGGQFIAVDTSTGAVVGLAFSLVIDWDDYSPQDNWVDLTSGGFFHNHNPKKGKTLYGAEVMVDPALQGRGIGKLLYEKRRELANKYGLKRIRAGARMRGYGKFKDKLSPTEYVKQVIENKIYDPTLSFQLRQGFVVIDVAKNYLYNDPESLGYAAVIEWLNPQFATEFDLKKQKESVEYFLESEKYIFEYLPRELHRLVRKATFALGEVIKGTEGKDFFEKVEKYRVTLKKMRGKTSREKLSQLFKDVERESSYNQLKIAHAFALHLEIVNVCEMAYRTWRLRLKPIPQSMKKSLDLKFVLTAHPTEARSRIVISLLQELGDVMIDAMNSNFNFDEIHLMSQMRLLWIAPLSKPVAPSVQGEAEFIFSLVFSNQLFDFLIAEKPSYNILLRTWVGGDKDGHPGVNEKVMLSSLSLSRGYIIGKIKKKLTAALNDVSRLGRAGMHVPSSMEQIKNLLKELSFLSQMNRGDGNRVKKWKMKFLKVISKSPDFIQKHHQIILCKRILEVFPAMVLSLELREDADEIKAALHDKNSPIRKMLVALKNISGPLAITFYARGLVVSHCETETDLEMAGKLVLRSTRAKALPVIPLFETRSALVNSRKILRNWFAKKSNMELAKRHWSGHFEVMLGYSDSSKEIGVLPSRLLIQKAMISLEKIIKKHQIKPVFFHGSGGSVARGGGSLSEQVQWWSASAVERPKMTVQGEMIQRMFSTKEILNSQCSHISTESLKRRTKKTRAASSKTLINFSRKTEEMYRGLVNDSKRLDVILKASPYRYLDVLRIGSRPSKRKVGEFDISQLRAIPWVLCWTQTRSLLPTWWGIGTAWAMSSAEEKDQLREEMTNNPMFSSFIKSLGFTLAKVDLEVWRLYFDNNENTKFFKEFETEFIHAVQCVQGLSGEQSLTWHRPWLTESIRLRAPHIHILNVLQILAMKREDEPLLKETLVGIACGMLTTG